MAMKNQNFEMFAGDTKNVTVTVTGVDLTGASVKWAMKKSIYNAEPDVYKDTLTGVTITAPDKFVIAFKPADTAALSGGFYHEAEVTDASGNVSTLLSGTITVNRSGV
ncbi:hypothetical protein BK120_08300 [Paenibacillus sp. FSL A5-0031]|uniref:hypothetical protein n=1 Tax=Paenibacillus sp. FSL A5-0031 TaxID=1920420 RepID=UPI00096C4D16|nr:hypothetical protein [Paenibacillus sp. FSL A5-0031]OME86914.1 hypothetical protein BK120_08300 [Paenibacillus sp. FSL A5-0031]